MVHVAQERDVARRTDRGLLDAGEQCDPGQQRSGKPGALRCRQVLIRRGIARNGNPDLARDEPLRIEPGILTQRSRETADLERGRRLYPTRTDRRLAPT